MTELERRPSTGKIDKVLMVVPNPPTRTREEEDYSYRTCGGDCPGPMREVTEVLPDPEEKQYTRYAKALEVALGRPKKTAVIPLLLKDLDFATAWYKVPGKKNVFLVPSDLGDETQRIVEKVGMPIVVIPSLDVSRRETPALVALRLQNVVFP